MKMSSFVGRPLLALYGPRQSCSILTILRFHQHSYTSSQEASNTAFKSKELPVNRAITPTVVPAFRRAAQFQERLAITDSFGDYTYKGLYQSSKRLSVDIENLVQRDRGAKIAFLCPNNATYIIAQWACWIGGHIAVPLTTLHPPELLEYLINDSDACLLLTTPEHVELMQGLAKKTKNNVMVIEDTFRHTAMKPENVSSEASPQNFAVVEPLENYEAGHDPQYYTTANALIIYTSGTTGKPKGVVLSHGNLHAQVSAMAQAWEWSPKDIVLHALPLHHLHGIVNVLLTPLYVGARCVMLERFDAALVWSHLLAIRTKQVDRPNMFMAVPTMYSLLIDEYQKIFAGNPRMKEYVKAVCSEKIRLMTSGSSRLQPTVFNQWRDITGHVLLERYGMTETGMILGNPLNGKRIPGYLGTPMPSVEVLVAEPKGPTFEVLVKGNSTGSTVVAPGGKATVGELLVKGPSVFKEYYKMPKATAKEFTPDGWFKTGDTVQYGNGIYQILGRSSVDIIKTGGYKVSALEIEAKLLQNPDISEVAVIGVPDITWGQKIAAIVVVRDDSKMDLPLLREWSLKHLASYAVPTVIRVVASIPKNSMGKINKITLLKDLFPEVEA